MFFTLLFLLVLPKGQKAYSFCPNCIHSSGRANTCNLFKQHPLYKDNPDANFIGKEICGEKGKYFRRSEEEEENNGSKGEKNEKEYKEKVIRMIRD